jgi:hypothetical protein
LDGARELEDRLRGPYPLHRKPASLLTTHIISPSVTQSCCYQAKSKSIRRLNSSVFFSPAPSGRAMPNRGKRKSPAGGAAIGGPPRALGTVRCLFERPTDKSSPSGHRQRSVERLAAISHPIEHRCRFGTVAILKSRHGELSNRDMVRQKSTARAVKSRESRRFSSPTEIAYWQ